MEQESNQDPTHKGKNRYTGSWQESRCKLIDLPFSPESLEQILQWGELSEGAPHTHQEIAHWCDRMYIDFLDTNTIPELETAASIAKDVDCQWDLFLVNTFKVEELRVLDFSTICLPLEWFTNWLQKLKSNTDPSDEA
jgi:hypothetical protein